MYDVRCSTCGDLGRHPESSSICPGCGAVDAATSCAACGGMKTTPLLVATGEARGCFASTMYQVAPMLTPRPTCPKCKKGVLSAKPV